MNKRYQHHLLRVIQRLRSSYFIVLILLSALTFVFAYRQNNLTALHLRDQLLVVDQQNGDIETALKNLRSFTYAHMNANLSGGSNNIYPPIQLKYRYERLVAAENARIEGLNGQLYTQAQAYCEQQVTSRVTINRVPCIQDYLGSHGAAVVQSIPDGLYKFDFVSPLWSPDLAGWSLVVTVILLIAYFVRMASEGVLRYRLRS